MIQQTCVTSRDKNEHALRHTGVPHTWPSLVAAPPPSVTYPWSRGSGAAGLSVEPASVSLTSHRVSDSYTRQVPTRALSLCVFLVAVRRDWFFTHVVVSSHISHVSVCSTDPVIAGDWLMRAIEISLCVYLDYNKQNKHN